MTATQQAPGRSGPVSSVRARAEESPVHDQRTAAILGVALGVCFTVCFVTGLVSHLIQHPPSWFLWPSRPAGLYRVNQGLHVATGLAAVPLLLAKLWSVYPNLFQWPPVRSVAQAVERLMLVPLVAGAVFMLFSGIANIAHWYPWRFSFPAAHYWMAWVTIGAIVAHLGAKIGLTRRALRRRPDAGVRIVDEPVEGGLTRRGFVGWAFAAAGLVTLTTVGQTVRPLQKLAFFAPRRPDTGPQGLPVNSPAGGPVRAAATDPAYRLRVRGNVPRELELSLADLRALPQRAARLPISCVEGWSTNADWVGVPVVDLLHRAGVPADRDVEVTVNSLQQGSRYATSELNRWQARDRDTLLALEVNGEPLDLDHGFPTRLIGPNRPGVHQTKWVAELVVR